MSKGDSANILEPFPKGEREAIQKAVEFTDKHFQALRCDHEAVAACVRCNAQYLAKVLRQLLSTNPRAGQTDNAGTRPHAECASEPAPSAGPAMAEEASWKERFDSHTKAVSEFLNELYAIMVDPCAEGEIKVDEMKAALIKAALLNREAANSRPTLAKLIEYLDGFFVSSNKDLPVSRAWISPDQWTIIKECVAEGLPLEHTIICGEVAYRHKKSVWGDETRATSPLEAHRVASREIAGKPKE